MSDNHAGRIVAHCHDERHDEPCPQYEGHLCSACAVECDPDAMRPFPWTDINEAAARLDRERDEAKDRRGM